MPFGNIEIADIGNMPSVMFRRVVKQSITDGTSGEGMGFILMPSTAHTVEIFKNLHFEIIK